MNYLNDLKDNMAAAVEALSELERCYSKGWTTAAEVHKLQLDCTLKGVKYCISCVRRKAEKLGISECDVKCVGGCVRRHTLGGDHERDR